MRPLPPLCLIGVTVLLPSAIRPMTGSDKTFCFLEAWSPLGNGLLFAEGLLEAVPIAPLSVSFLFAARFLIVALLFASSISKKKTGKFAEKQAKLNIDADGLTLTGTLLVLNSRRSGFRSVTVPMDGVEIDKFCPRPLFWFSLCENSFKKVVLLDINLWAPSH